METILDVRQIERFKAHLKASGNDPYNYFALRDAIRYVVGKNIPYSESREIIEWLDVNRHIEISRVGMNFHHRLWRITD